MGWQKGERDKGAKRDARAAREGIVSLEVLRAEEVPARRLSPVALVNASHGAAAVFASHLSSPGGCHVYVRTHAQVLVPVQHDPSARPNTILLTEAQRLSLEVCATPATTAAPSHDS